MISWYPVLMTMVDILYRCVDPPTDQVAQALARVSDVYGIRKLRFDRGASTLRVEYDATRLNVAVVTKLIREAGLEIAPDVPDAQPQIAAPPPSAPAS
jgi:hypothetical protein